MKWTRVWAAWGLCAVGCGGELSKAVDETNLEGDAPGECTDGVDNDDNGAVDCDDPGCAGSDDCVAAEENAPPSMPEVAVTPEAPEPGDALTCTVVQPGVDPEGLPVTHRFAWVVDGAGTAFTTDTVPEDETAGEEVWTCQVVANDGTLDGPAGEASVTTGPENAAPGAPTVAIVPPGPATNQPVRCDVVVDATDPDGDALTYHYTWQRDGVDAGITASELSPGDTDLGETWTCAVVASDGALDGPAGTAEATIEEARYSGDVTGLGGTVYSASNCFLGCDEGTYAADNAFDDNPGTAGYSTWHTTWRGGPEWIAVDFGDGNDKTITRYGLMGASFHEGYRVRDFSLQGSHDGETWVTIDSVSDANLAYVMYGGEPFSYWEVANEQAFRHWRYLITDNEGGQTYADEVGIVEIEMFEAEPVD